MACRSGCVTGGHRSWGECARAANMRVAYCGIGGGDASVQRQWDKELGMFRDAQAQGVRPAGTSEAKVTAALRASDASGSAFVGGR